MEEFLAVEELHGEDRLQRHIDDGLRRQRHGRRHGRRFVFRQEPFEVGVAVVGVDEERRRRFRLAQRRDAADVAV